MIDVPTNTAFHYVGDAAAWIAAFLGGRWVYRHRRSAVRQLERQSEPGYFLRWPPVPRPVRGRSGR